jgi:hypothetical protein
LGFDLFPAAVFFTTLLVVVFLVAFVFLAAVFLIVLVFGALLTVFDVFLVAAALAIKS